MTIEYMITHLLTAEFSMLWISKSLSFFLVWTSFAARKLFSDVTVIPLSPSKYFHKTFERAICKSQPGHNLNINV